jgi:uncharacterized protein (DUF1810 family)
VCQKANNMKRMGVTDPFDLERFVKAQSPVWDQVLAELREGRKRSHWMWFVFPQLRGLGHSATALRYGITSLAEARAYCEHELLGVRLAECTELVNRIDDRSARDIFGHPDDLKFHSCMTLFAMAQPGDADFPAALEKYFGGTLDAATMGLLGRAA